LILAYKYDELFHIMQTLLAKLNLGATSWQNGKNSYKLGQLVFTLSSKNKNKSDHNSWIKNNHSLQFSVSQLRLPLNKHLCKHHQKAKRSVSSLFLELSEQSMSSEWNARNYTNSRTFCHRSSKMSTPSCTFFKQRSISPIPR